MVPTPSKIFHYLLHLPPLLSSTEHANKFVDTESQMFRKFASNDAKFERILSKTGDLAKLKRLIEKYPQVANVNAKRFNNWTPLHIASFRGFVEVVEFLLINCKADCNLTLNEDGAQAIHLAAIGGKGLICKVLLETGKVDVNSVAEKKGNTALHYAAWENHTSVATTLIGARANINLKNLDGYTPLLVACYRGNCAVAKLLLHEVNTSYFFFFFPIFPCHIHSLSHTHTTRPPPPFFLKPPVFLLFY